MSKIIEIFDKDYSRLLKMCLNQETEIKFAIENILDDIEELEEE